MICDPSSNFENSQIEANTVKMILFSPVFIICFITAFDTISWELYIEIKGSMFNADQLKHNSWCQTRVKVTVRTSIKPTTRECMWSMCVHDAVHYLDKNYFTLNTEHFNVRNINTVWDNVCTISKQCSSYIVLLYILAHVTIPLHVAACQHNFELWC